MNGQQDERQGLRVGHVGTGHARHYLRNTEDGYKAICGVQIKYGVNSIYPPGQGKATCSRCLAAAATGDAP